MKKLLLLLIPFLMAAGEVGSVAGKADSAISTIMGVSGASISTLCGKDYNDGDAAGKSMLFTHDSANHVLGKVNYTHGSNLSEYYLEFWIRFSEVDTWGGNGDFYAVRVGTSVDGENIRVVFTSNAGGTDVTTLNAVVYLESGTQNVGGTINANADTWHQVRVYWKAATDNDSNNGISTIWFDNMSTEIATNTALDNYKNAKYFSFGECVNSDIDSSTLEIYLDDYKLGTSAGGSDLHSDDWNTATNPEDAWTSKTDTGGALSVDATVYH